MGIKKRSLVFKASIVLTVMLSIANQANRNAGRLHSRCAEQIIAPER